MKNVLKVTVFSAFLLMGSIFVAPNQAHALFLDELFEDAPPGPHCLFMDCDDNNNSGDPSVINSYNTNSFNTQTNIGSQYNNTGAGTQNVGLYYPATYTPAPTPTQTAAPVNNNYNYNYNTNTGGGTTYVPTNLYYPNYNYTPAPVYHYPVYQQPSLYYNLTVSCSPSTTYTNTGSYVTWNAYAYGGYGGYTYRWSGTDGLTGSHSSISTYYHKPGIKYGYVTVRDSSGRTESVQCSSYVNVAGTYYQQPVYQQPVYHQPISYASNLQVACAADTTSTKIGIPVTWSAEAYLPGYPSSNFSYSWSGSEGLYGSQSSAVTKYSTTGTKNATVTVVAPNGQSQTRACSNTVTVKSTYVAKKVAQKAPSPTPEVVYLPETGTAASLFSLGNVPWGWVGLLIILVLIGIILYMTYNRKKI